MAMVLWEGVQSLYLLGGWCFLMAFLGGRNRSTQNVLHKEEKKVREIKVVAGDGVWDHRGPVARLCAQKNPLVVAKSLRKRLDDHKNSGENMVSIVKRTCCTK